MPSFEYEALKLTGERASGTLEAPSREQAHDALRRGGLYPSRITEVTVSRRARAAKPLSGNELSVMLGQFASLLESGIPFLRCLEILANNAEKQRMRALLSGIYDAVQSGSSLSGALESANGAFPPLLVQTVRAGEMGSSLTQAMRAMAAHYEKRHMLQERVRGAVTYPCIVLAVAIVIVAFLMISVLPTFSALFEQSGVQLPAATRVLLGIGAFIGGNIFPLAGCAALLILLARALLRSERARIYCGRKLLGLRLIGRIVRYTNASLYARTLGTLMSAGVSFADAMTMSAKVVSNAYIRDTLPAIEGAVRQGVTLNEALKDAGWAPDILLSMATLGEESGMLEEMLARAADQLDNEVNVSIAKATAMIEPGIMIFMGVVVGFIVLSVLMPMFTLSSAIGL